MKTISVEEMDRLDDELRELIRKMWPVQARKKKLLNLLVPPNSGMYQRYSMKLQLDFQRILLISVLKIFNKDVLPVMYLLFSASIYRIKW